MSYHLNNEHLLFFYCIVTHITGNAAKLGMSKLSPAETALSWSGQWQEGSHVAIRRQASLPRATRCSRAGLWFLNCTVWPRPRTRCFWTLRHGALGRPEGPFIFMFSIFCARPTSKQVSPHLKEILDVVIP